MGRSSADFRAAAAVLELYIETARDVFLAAGFDRLAATKVRVDAAAGDGGRHFAACRTDGELILLSPEMVSLPQDTAMGIMLHEFGHAADFSYPAQISFGRGGAARVVDVGRRGGSVDIDAWLRDWEDRDDDEIERCADRIAEGVAGVKIGYAGPCQLQSVGRGKRPRPPGLR